MEDFFSLFPDKQANPVSILKSGGFELRKGILVQILTKIRIINLNYAFNPCWSNYRFQQRGDR